MSGTRSLECRPLFGAVWPAIFHRATAAAGLGLLIAAAAAILWRQAAGALRHPLDPIALLAAVVAATAVAVAVRGSLHRSDPRRPLWLDRALTLVVSLALLALTVGLCLSGASTACLVAVCIVVASEEAWAWRRGLRHCRTVCGPATERVASCQSAGAGCQSVAEPGQVANLSHDLPEEDIVQQLTRSRAESGAEEIAGWLRTTFAPDQRTASVHVAFCPPLHALPEVSVEQIDGPDARIKVAQVLPYGARLDLKLAAASDEPVNVLLQFSART